VLGASETKNWTPPKAKKHVQTLTEEIMANHSELISATFHGVPPGPSKVYTMSGGSHLDRAGNPDDPDDIMVILTGVTVLDPRWQRAYDTVKKYIVQLPLKDGSEANVGVLVLAYPGRSDNAGSEISRTG
jgi:hypothetical protein